ncbi:N-acetylglucosamine kinase [Microbacterium hydrocarbonoxydans]|uniref:N-acetylglucosamine kinase n=1 Tax=Microbacterium hydrocarbonoxydans TaxID=273678 RepID=UPI003D9750E8
MNSSLPFVAVDLGKTRCRVLKAAGGSWERHDGPGAPGLASHGGVEDAFQSIDALLTRIDIPIAGIGVGAAGAWTAPHAAEKLARRLAAAAACPVVVASDVVTAHIGALGGGDGTLLIAGTGAAALGVGIDGIRLVDGWGPELGDFGGGSWIGREALRAVVRADAGLGAATSLTTQIAQQIGVPSAIASWIATAAPLARRLAALAPLVLDAAESGDLVARGIVDEAVQLLTASAVAAAPEGRVALHGGLTAHDWFRTRLAAAVSASGRVVTTAAGDALDGALLLAVRSDLPHERFAHRAE